MTTTGEASTRFQRLFSPLLESHLATRWLVVLILVLMATANLPWTLDDYDQAKQAYASHELAHGGDWLFQHVPHGATATKPPLAAWVSVAVQEFTNSWDIAWRLPGFLCAIVLLCLLIRTAHVMMPEGGGLVAACAFGVNFFTPRLATLVRTDMMLALWIFLCGWLVFRKIRDNTAWTTGERLAFAASMTAALLTKGPIIYAFLLPGLVAFLILAPRDARSRAWSGWWTWLLPLAIFGAWVAAGILTNKGFYDDVVVREFMSRFDQSLRGNERRQPLWFYLPHAVHKFLPWSLLAIALPAFSKNVREAFRRNPQLLWLACWSLGGLVCMTFIPSKRVDRIYPILPPLCLLLVAMAAECRCGARVRAWLGAAVVFAVLFWGTYFAGIVAIAYHDRADALVQVGRTSRLLCGTRPLAVVGGEDEGMLFYTATDRFLKPADAAQQWSSGRIDAVLVPERNLADFPVMPPPVLVAKGKRESRYFLFIRNEIR